MSSFDLNHQIKAVKREIGYRRHVYPKRIKEGKMQRIEADYQIDIMEKVLRTLVVVLETEEFKLE